MNFYSFYKYGKKHFAFILKGTFTEYEFKIDFFSFSTYLYSILSGLYCFCQECYIIFIFVWCSFLPASFSLGSLWLRWLRVHNFHKILKISICISSNTFCFTHLSSSRIHITCIEIVLQLVHCLFCSVFFSRYLILSSF